jgi:biotin-dependent carboxylase-like uncharacterized protein
LSRFEIVNPGVLTTYQDLGRVEMLKYALAACGAMDQTSVQLINLLLGNQPTDAVLEITLTGLTMKVLVRSQFAVGGADLGLKINGQHAPRWTIHDVKAGDVIGFTTLNRGVRAYLGVPSGFDAPEILGSRSVYLRGSLGRPLKKGDEISALVQAENCRHTERKLPERFIPNLDMTQPFRVLPGPQFDYFSAKGVDVFSSTVYTVSPISDRQGIRTDGQPVERIKGPDIITDPTPIGAIQVPGSGLPILLHRDAQVTGGYAKIALLCRADIDRAGQLCPGDKIRFQFVDRQTALSMLNQHEGMLAEAQKALASYD